MSWRTARVILGLGLPLAAISGVSLARAANSADALAQLEARAAAENRGPAPSPAFQRDLFELIARNTLSSGADFFRAARLATAPLPTFRSTRTAYELTLAAVARGHRPAEGALAGAWESLLSALGRPMRVDIMGLMSPGGEPGAAGFDPANAAAAAILRDPTGARTRAATAADNAELLSYAAGNAPVGDQSPAGAEVGATADAARRRAARVRAVAETGGLRTPADFVAAAKLLLGSASFADLQLAHEFALCALLLGAPAAPPLAAATYDRLLNLTGYDQRFGTQRLAAAPGRPSIRRPVDETGISDAEREALGCPPLADERASAPHSSGSR